MIVVVVDFAVVNNDVVADRHWLGTVSDIDDTQTAMPETDISIDKYASVVRPAMVLHVAHSHERIRRNLPARTRRKCYPIDTAHTVTRK